jgi:tetratricopeptide (TPR) repeat protein
MGYHERERGDFASAERNYRLAVRQGGDDEHMAISLGGLGKTYLDLGRYREAEEALGRSAEYHVRLAKAKGPDSIWVRMAGDVMEDLGISQIKQAKSVEGIKNYVSGLEVEQKIRDYETGVEKHLFAARVLRELREYPAALHWIEQAQHNAISLNSLHDPKFRFHEIWPECLKELVAIYRESEMIQDKEIARKVMLIERNIRGYDEQATGKN